MPGSASIVTQAVSGAGNIFSGTGDVYVINQPLPLPPEEVSARKDLHILLDRVKTFWIKGVLEKSVHAAAFLDLGKHIEAGMVDHPWEMVLELPDQDHEILAPNTKIIDIFDQRNRTLLILGAPGSGKTITLIELARDLITRAETDEAFSQPIPVVFSLCSWGAKRQPLEDWMVVELSTKYQIPARIGHSWLENHRILPLLDDLDEVRQEHREACVKAINTFGKTCGLAGLAVCSRLQEYVTLPLRLKLNGAISLQPLTQEQIDHYLAMGEDNLKDLRAALQADTDLQSLAKTPLMLSIMSLAYQSVPHEGLADTGNGTPEERREHLFDTYIERMFKRKGQTAPSYTAEYTKGGLAWLAQRMIRHNQTIFLIEDLQPSWLRNKKQWLAYFISSRTITGLIFIMGFALRGYLLNDPSDTWRLVIGGLISGMTIGLIDGLHFEQSLHITNTKKFTPFWGTIFRFIIITGIGGAILGYFEFSSPMTFHIILGVTFGLVFGLWKNQQSIYQDIQTVESTGLTLQGALKGMIFGLLAVVFYNLLLLVNRIYLPQDVASGLLNRNDALSIGLEGFYGSLVGAILGGISGSKIEIKTFPNQGIQISLKKAIFPGFILGLLLGLIWIFLEHLYIKLEYEKFTPYGAYDWKDYLLNALMFGSTLFLWYGGFEVIKHVTLRLILTLTRVTPWQYAHFLDHASDRLFLQKVGGGYTFIHRYLMVHFADLFSTKSRGKAGFVEN